jgi:cell division protein FtsB
MKGTIKIFFAVFVVLCTFFLGEYMGKERCASEINQSKSEISRLTQDVRFLKDSIADLTSKAKSVSNHK